MGEGHARDQAWADERYKALLMPAMIDDMGISIHLDIDRTAKLLDNLADIDAIGIVGPDLFGIGWRIQEGAWDTFTVRFERSSRTLTQYAKVSRAIEQGGIYPKITVQAYIDGDILRYAVAETKPFYAWIKANFANRDLVDIRSTDGARFLVIRFEDVEAFDWCVIREKKLDGTQLKYATTAKTPRLTQQQEIGHIFTQNN